MTMPLGKTGPGQWLAVDGAERDAIGSRENLREGNTCFTQSDSEIDVCESVDGLDASTWSRKRKREWHFHWIDSTAGRRYAPWAAKTAVGDGSMDTADSAGVPPYNGTILGLRVNSGVTTPGSTTAGIHFDENTTPASTNVQTIDTIDVWVDFIFNQPFLATDSKIHISLTSAGVREGIWATLFYEVDLLTGPFAS